MGDGKPRLDSYLLVCSHEGWSLYVATLHFWGFGIVMILIRDLLSHLLV